MTTAKSAVSQPKNSSAAQLEPPDAAPDAGPRLHGCPLTSLHPLGYPTRRGWQQGAAGQPF